MSILNDVTSRRAKNLIKNQQQPAFPLVYDATYGPYKPITSIVESYKKDFINLLLTSPGEWPMHPEVGVGLKHYLFEYRDSPKLQSLAPTIKSQLSRHLPQVELVDLVFDYQDNDLDNNYVKVVLAYLILGSVTYASLIAPQAKDVVEVSDLSRQQLQSLDILNRSQSLVSDLVIL